MDQIDARNFQDRLRRSVVKFWRVRFVQEGQEDEKEEDFVPKTEEEIRAMEIFERLQAEASEDEEKKAAEQRAAYEEAAWRERTGASGVYGQKEVESEEDRERIAKILSERSDAFLNMIDDMTQ